MTTLCVGNQIEETSYFSLFRKAFPPQRKAQSL